MNNTIKSSKEKNGTPKKNANGDGSFYYSQALNKWIGQLTLPNGKRMTITQKNKETKTELKKRYEECKAKIHYGTYIEKSNETIISIAKQHIENKHKDGTTSDRSYKRDLETLQQIQKTCSNFCNIPIQKVTIMHVEEAKKDIRKYTNSVISKIWSLLTKSFSIACSPSRKLLTYNIMLDETLKKPISEKKTRKVTALTEEESKRLNSILDNEERNHQYRNVVKMQYISGMRIGEVLARSLDDYLKDINKLNVHNTLTQDENYKIIIGEHTKTYNKLKQCDEGQRFLPLDNLLFGELIKIIAEQMDKGITNKYNLLFWDYKKETFITPNEINLWLKRLNKKYNITKEELSTHRLRHTALTYWKVKGIDLSAIQYLAGHVEGSNITEKVYIDISQDYINNQIKKVIL